MNILLAPCPFDRKSPIPVADPGIPVGSADPLGAADLRRRYLLAKAYPKTELGAVGRGVHRRCPPDPPKRIFTQWHVKEHRRTRVNGAIIV